ncbi:MAG: hypothetical protein HOP12_06390 [Candidatus Eisenbacteria bacterium]|uniref:Glycosyltransferase RgtA/B/C/D-like domain-containing protein n=1 Tax=Eiseniibacteriota bacterium TaxID=2212470 RepID=A0A849SPC0_UNCEI|nr:hypothetical protein [Candidatus Eisenbacteria bacterium]
MSTTVPIARPRMPTPLGLGLVLALALALRLFASPAATERNMDPDSAHLLNVARCFERGEGFSNPALWPAWMSPERLPMPETFKEPGDPFAIAMLMRASLSPFGAGVAVSLIGGLLAVLGTWALARNLGFGRGAALAAAFALAINPHAIQMSVRVMVDAPFAGLLTGALAAAAWRAGSTTRPLWLDVATGALLGAAFLVRGFTLVAIPAVLVALVRPPVPRLGTWMRSAVVMALAAAVVASPFVLRNLRLFGVPFYSDVGAFGQTPYADVLGIMTSLERPTASPFEFLLAHLPQVAQHLMESVYRFGRWTLPNEMAGGVWWMPLLVAGAWKLRRDSAAWPLWAYLGVVLPFVFAITWDARYFTAAGSCFAVLTGVGAAWLWPRFAARALAGHLRGRHVLIAAAMVAALAQAVVARTALVRFAPAEIAAARAEAAFLRAHLSPDEAVMVFTTSFYSWFADRPSHYVVVADDARFESRMQRYRVRYAILPTRELESLARRYPERRLPRALVPLRSDPETGVTVFRVEAAALPDAD